ncbi:iron chelate uptake ABC transporter family permease subunit [Micromonospora sp. WMMD1082]|uniref:iron chelate uptake ABC transporter family permease subunit n=1 Tax=Micromonospora sp. WMMD1082 TaxID=3016104 RepID=UPI002416CFC1|nr:iron chelate uptake ABC transporter family permease subunit [Micromonospora sp. WMMD1082]MDG4795690.1 iron chelate uptake ABC transporter family permease subunit [Micromonospora sp. WMMD1082]
MPGSPPPWLLLCAPLVVAVLPALGVLRLGDEAAAALGLHVGRARVAVLGLAAVLVAVVVGPCGPITWSTVGLPNRRHRPVPLMPATLPLVPSPHRPSATRRAY